MPKSVVRAINLEVGRTYRAGVVENRHDPKGQTPWFVTFIEGADFSLQTEEYIFSPLVDLFDAEPEGSSPRCRPSVSRRDSCVPRSRDERRAVHLRPRSLLRAAPARTSTSSEQFFDNWSEISCAKVYKSGEQVRSTQTVWCADVQRLLK